ncbi:MAG: arylesterase [Gammaproteobacteria bacterium]|nr:arylesterase [Gammaproteobacteria bacterium]
MTKVLVLMAVLLTTAVQARSSDGQHLLVFGDSLSAAYGIDIEKGWASLLAQHWQQNGKPHRLTNASISGETTDGGLARLPVTLQEIKPDIVAIELGANDGLRGHPLTRIQANLERMVDLVEAAGAQPIVIGISLPPSHGPRYVDGFRSLFAKVAEAKQVPFIDFYRAEFFDQPGYIQEDGMHPTEAPQPLIRDAVLGFLEQQNLLQ